MPLRSEPIYIVRPDDTYHYGPGFVPYYYKNELDTAKGPCMNCVGMDIVPPTASAGGICVSACTHVVNMGGCAVRGRKGEKGDKGDKGDPGTTTYTELTDKPQINDVILEGNKTFEDLGAYSITDDEIENIIDSIV